jgi:hypothetical protein
VSRCDANGDNWCCAGAAGQDLGGLECCSTNLTTALEPYPFAAVDRSGQPSSVAKVATTVVLPSTTLTPGFPSSSSLSSSSTSTPNSPSTQSTSQSSTTAIPPTAPTTASPQPASKTPNSTLGLEIGVPPSRHHPPPCQFSRLSLSPKLKAEARSGTSAWYESGRSARRASARGRWDVGRAGCYAVGVDTGECGEVGVAA